MSSNSRSNRGRGKGRNAQKNSNGKQWKSNNIDSLVKEIEKIKIQMKDGSSQSSEESILQEVLDENSNLREKNERLWVMAKSMEDKINSLNNANDELFKENTKLSQKNKDLQQQNETLLSIINSED